MPTFNDAQRRAVDFRDGTMLLLAGPGSGKTFVITHRIKALIESGVKDSEILVITFTKAAAVQMRERFEKLCESACYRVNFGTFHAVFYNILRSNKDYRDLKPVTDKEKLNILNASAESLGLSERIKNYDDRMMLLSLFSACKNNGNDPLVFEQEFLEQNEFISLFNSYNSKLKDCDRLDFDDMVNLCLDLLSSDSDELEKWRKRFRYILIDEFQDISENQYRLVRMLAQPQNNIFAVGDDDQSIYRFRGAKTGLMRALLEDVPGAVREDLNINYRSSGKIVEYSSSVIAKNKDRFLKNTVASRESGDPVEIIKASNNMAQRKAVEDLILSHCSKDHDGRAALLVRTNRQAEDWAYYLRSRGIRVDHKTGKPIFSSGEIRDVLAYLSAADGDRSRQTFLRIINRPVRFIKRDALKNETVTKKDLLNACGNDISVKRNIETLFNYLDRLRFQRPYLAVKFIRNVIGYDRYVKETLPGDAYSRYMDEMSGFEELVRGLDSYRDVCDRLKEVRELVSNTASENNDKDVSPCLTIMTYHGSKGLEFDTVILPDINEGLVPPRSADSSEAIEEERRIFYVAMTRAKNRLYILYRLDEGKRISRFVEKP